MAQKEFNYRLQELEANSRELHAIRESTDITCEPAALSGSNYGPARALKHLHQRLIKLERESEQWRQDRESQRPVPLPAPGSDAE